MSALFHVSLSAPARRVQPYEPMPLTVEHFSRTLDERRPTERSSTAQIVPMGADAPMHPAERLVLRASAVAGLALFLILIAERFLP